MNQIASPNAAQIDRFLSHCPGSLSDVKIALDIGSRDGETALTFADKLPNAKVYAFECNPAAIELCRRNLAGCERITLVEKAVLHQSGPVTFHAIDPARTRTPHPDGNIGASSLFLANGNYPLETYAQNPVQVPGITLHDWAASEGIESVDLMWMDMQGAELLALMGMGPLLQTVKQIQAEVWYRPAYENQPLAGDLKRFMASAGFWCPDEARHSDWMGDCIFTRRKGLAG